MEPRRGWLLAASVPALGACTAAAVEPRLAPAADGVLLLAGISCAALMWIVGGRRERGVRGWRLIAVSALFPALGALTATLVAPADPLDTVVLGWLVSVPGYVLALAGGLTLFDAARLRGRGRRVGVELALFGCASVLATQLLFVGPDGRWQDLAGPERLALGTAVLVTSAMMAGALTVLGVIESRRRRAALLLLIASVSLTVGRGLATSALLDGWVGGTAASRFLVVGGLVSAAFAVLADPGRGGDRRPGSGAATRLGQVLPHLAMVVATVVAAAATLAGHAPSAVTVAGVVLCVLLATVHRWLTAGEEQLLGVRLRRSEAWFRSLVLEGGDAIVILDDDLRVTWSSPALARILGPAADTLVGRPLLASVHPEDAPSLAGVLPHRAPAGDAGPAGGLQCLRLPDADGTWHVLEAVVSDLRSDTSVGGVVLRCRDITARHVREQVLHDVAYSDPRTGLPNRAGLELALRRALERTGPPVTVLLLELDGLAGAREDAGHDVVRYVVGEVGRRLRATVRTEDLVARMGGSAFAVLAHGEGDEAHADRDAAEADQLAARCLAVVEQPIMTTRGIVDLTGAVGLAPLVPGGTVEEVLTRADLAVRAARRRAGSAVRWTEELGAAAARRDRLRTDLVGAAARGELALLLDPIVSLTEQRVVGVEALLRWGHPVLGDVPPSEFLPLAERAGVAGELGRWLLREAMTAVGGLPVHGPAIRLGVDASTGWASAGTLVDDVEAALRETGLAPERLILEITEETVLADDERIGLDLTTLRSMGVHVALEGYGTGHSGLTHLTRLPVDILKLDRSLVSRIDRDAQTRALTESVLGIGRTLGLDVVAEGVETPAQLSLLCGYGHGFAQGYLIARPMPAPDLATLLSDGVGALWPGLVGQR